MSGAADTTGKGKVLGLLAPPPLCCPNFKVYFYSLNGKENQPRAPSCSILLPRFGAQSKMSAARRNVFTEGQFVSISSAS